MGRILNATKEQVGILFKHDVFKQSACTRKRGFVIRSSSFCFFAGEVLAEPHQVWAIQEILQEQELHIGTASLGKGVLLRSRLDRSLRRKGMLCYMSCVGNTEQHQERDPRWISWWNKKERKSA